VIVVDTHRLGEFAKRAMPVAEPFPLEQPIPPLLDLAYAAFGPNRMLWGSDFPPVSGREGYRNALRLPMDHLAAKSRHDRDRIFGGTAKTLFSFR
jgi:L-fuconolactonase